MATITVRALDATGNPTMGNGQANFLADADSVAQIIGTRIKLLLGEWWEDITQGTPLFTSMKSDTLLGQVLQARILGTPYVTAVQSVTTTYDPGTRRYTYSATVLTEFGVVSVSNVPSSSANLGS